MFKQVLKSERLTIRPMEASDLPFFVKLRNRCVKWLHDDRRFSLTQTKKWFALLSDSYYIIELHGETAGYIRTSNWDLYNKNVYIGADIEPSYRRQGVASESLRIFINFLFTKQKFNKVSLEVLDFNTSARHLYKKLGFEIEGRRKHHVKKGKKYVDSIIMAIHRPSR